MIAAIVNFFDTLISYVSTAVNFLVGIIESFVKFIEWLRYSITFLGVNLGGFNLLVPIWAVLSLLFGICVLIRILELI